MNACCGHGVQKEAYIQYFDESCIRGNEAIKAIKNIKRIKMKCTKCKNGKIKVKMTITSPVETVNCPTCNGTGETVNRGKKYEKNRI